jgi:hypothetical protein
MTDFVSVLLVIDVLRDAEYSHMYVHVCVCVCVCVYVCMYVCMYVCSPCGDREE